MIMLYSAGSSVIATQIFGWWSSGNMEEAIILGLFEALMIMICFVAAQFLGRQNTHPEV